MIPPRLALPCLALPCLALLYLNLVDAVESDLWTGDLEKKQAMRIWHHAVVVVTVPSWSRCERAHNLNGRWARISLALWACWR